MREKLNQAQIDAAFNPEKEIVIGTIQEGLAQQISEQNEADLNRLKTRMNLENFNRGLDNLVLGMFGFAYTAPFVIGGGIVYGGAAISSTGSFIGSTVIPRTVSLGYGAYKGIRWTARTYHNTFGRHGGYTNAAWTYFNQSISNNDWTGRTHNAGGYFTALFTRNDASLVEQTAAGALGSGGFMSLSFQGKVEGIFNTPGHYSSTTLLNGGLLQPFAGALGTRLGLSNGASNFIVNSATGGLQYGIEGTKKW